MAFEFIADALAERKQAHLYRQLTPIDGAQQREITVGGQRYLNFSSNDYLALANEPLLVKAWQQGLEQYGCGSGASALVTGYSKAHQQLEEKLKAWLSVDAVALFNSGYSANQAVLKLLLSKDDLLLQDRLNHASLMEAGSLLPCKMLRFRHNDCEHLASLLAKPATNKLIVSEGVFSMDGDGAPIAKLLQLRDQHNAWLMIDDAHGLGVLGRAGTGTVCATGLHNHDIDIYMATFGKALGVGGAMVAGSVEFIEYVTNFSKPYIYTTAMPPAQAVAVGAAIDIVMKQPWRLQQLQDNIHYFRRMANQLGLPLMASQSAIQPVLIGDSERALQVSKALRELGFYCAAIRPPTVAKGSARLRITLTAKHQIKDIDALLNALHQVLA
ncbi:8-amino-7-oxononanoate synthase [Motilimonas eburnea]|uniref:8-amino-7-oxononanoate synthase n=1 Tax=Motilimonas eburnea TaxID=1737488 RepID=UPI001E5E5F95|nr:8-amino-7-oxononanoate synthase [Motilimonas eburnea]MCE2570059.1 8-amino-7-oxononanoate synthase [Motilimonas eburnea]